MLFFSFRIRFAFNAQGRSRRKEIVFNFFFALLRSRFRWRLCRIEMKILKIKIEFSQFWSTIYPDATVEQFQKFQSKLFWVPLWAIFVSVQSIFYFPSNQITYDQVRYCRDSKILWKQNLRIDVRKITHADFLNTNVVELTSLSAD